MQNFAPGFVIGSYRVVRALGAGGMGAVYEVEHPTLGVHYALKTFTLEEGHAELFRKRFLAEGRLLARLRHPNLVHVFDLAYDEANDLLYFVMDLVLFEDGEAHTLAEIEQGSAEEGDVVQWFGELCQVLAYVHAQGVVHRDIKLGNILLAPGRRVVLSDFGISKVLGEKLRTDIDMARTMTEAATGGKFIMGTRGYMAPEVVRGEEVTPAADVYALGVAFFYLLTGVWYEPGSRALELLETLELPWAQIIPQMLANAPKERPTELCTLAKRLSVGTQPGARSARGWKAVAMVGGGLAAVVAISAAAWFAFRTPAPSAAEDEFDEAFGAEGIYEVLK